MGRVQAPPANIPGTYREVAWTGRGGSWRLISAGIWGVLVDEGIAGVRDSDRGHICWLMVVVLDSSREEGL